MDCVYILLSDSPDDISGRDHIIGVFGHESDAIHAMKACMMKETAVFVLKF
jgi:hypothetical protein